MLTFMQPELRKLIVTKLENEIIFQVISAPSFANGPVDELFAAFWGILDIWYTRDLNDYLSSTNCYSSFYSSVELVNSLGYIQSAWDH